MSSFLDSLQFWHWWILGAVLAAVEALAPGMFFIWFGAAALIVGLVALILPGMGWELEVLLFADPRGHRRLLRPQVSASPGAPDRRPGAEPPRRALSRPPLHP